MESIAKVFAELLKPELLKIIGISGLMAVIVSLVVYNVFAYIGNFGFAELAARNKIRRDFANATGIQISKLANKHYWAIANAAGTLSVGLRDYLEALELSLYVARDLLQVSSSLLAEKASSETFPSFVHLVGALHNFQFIGSNDYLLPDYSAGRHLRRLYNEFRESLLSATPERGDDLATGLLQWRKRDSEAKTDTKDGEDKSDEKKGKSDSKSSADKFDIEAALDAASRRAGLQDDPALADPEMEGHRKVWEEWLCDNLPDVLNAAVSLEAFSRVMQHQIAELHRDWFHDRRRDRRSADELAAARRAVERKAWFETLTHGELAVLGVAREQGDFMTALRRTAGGQPFAPKRDDTQPHTAEGPRGEGLAGPRSDSSPSSGGGKPARPIGSQETIEPDKNLILAPVIR